MTIVSPRNAGLAAEIGEPSACWIAPSPMPLCKTVAIPGAVAATGTVMVFDRVPLLSNTIVAVEPVILNGTTANTWKAVIKYNGTALLLINNCTPLRFVGNGGTTELLRGRPVPKIVMNSPGAMGFPRGA